MYRKQSNRSVDDVLADIEAAAKAEGFVARECRVLEVCNPRQASEVLATDMALNMALPCRLSIYEDESGRTTVGMIPPTRMLALVSDDTRIADAARSVEQAMERIIDTVI